MDQSQWTNHGLAVASVLSNRPSPGARVSENLRRTGWDKPPESKSWQNAWWYHIQRTAYDLVTIENNLIDVAPKLVDDKARNFQLREDSPAWKMGFNKIPFEKIGLYKDDTRATWPVTHAVTPLPEYRKR